MASKRGMNRYPRPGQRLAPNTLREVLVEPVPKGLLRGTSLQGKRAKAIRLCDLDESVWDKLPEEAVVELAEIVVDRVAVGCSRKSLRQRHFPRPPDGTLLDELNLEHRTRLCLEREGFADNPATLGDRTLGEVMEIRAFGPRCLVDLLSGLETQLARQTGLYRELTVEAERLLEIPEAARMVSDDLRFGPLMYEVDIEAESAKEMARRLIARPQDPPDPLFAAEQLRQLRQVVEAMSKLTFEEELIRIFAPTRNSVPTRNQRNREILIGYYGWEDGRRHTLAEIGALHGMTRERTRQICAKLVKRKDPAAILAPVTERTLTLIGEHLPAPADRLEAEIHKAGLTAVGVQLENVIGAAKLLDRPAGFSIVRVEGQRLAVRPDRVTVPVAAVELAKKEIYYHGLSEIGNLERILSKRFPGLIDSAIVIESLRLIDGFRWLDESAGWFRLMSISKHGLPKAIDKILAVAGEISVRDLRRAVGRNRRMWKVPPPEKVLLEFCRGLPGVRIDGRRIIPEATHDWKKAIRGVEATLVKILKDHGPVMERGKLEDLCVAAGMNRFSFHAFIACSPVVAQFGHSVYGLLGAKVSRQSLKGIVADRRAERSPKRVLDSHGRTDDGRLWLAYRLSKAASTYAVITVPAAFKAPVSGKFQLLSEDGNHVGTLAAKDGRAWGLGAFLRQQDAQVGDRVVITLDLDQRTATIAMEQ